MTSCLIGTLQATLLFVVHAGHLGSVVQIGYTEEKRKAYTLRLYQIQQTQNCIQHSQTVNSYPTEGQYFSC